MKKLRKVPTHGGGVRSKQPRPKDVALNILPKRECKLATKVDN